MTARKPLMRRGLRNQPSLTGCTAVPASPSVVVRRGDRQAAPVEVHRR